MKTLNARSLALVTALTFGLLGAANVSQAAWIVPEGVAGSSFYSYGQHPDNTINGSGLSAESTAGTHDNHGGAATMWHSGVGYDSGGGAPVVDDQWLIFTLPGTYSLSDAHFWNMNQSGLTVRSIRQYDLDVSTDGVNWTPVFVNDTLNQAGGTPTEPVQTRSLAQPKRTRFVRLGIDTDYSGSATDYVGLSEARFEGGLLKTGPAVSTAFAPTGPGLPKPLSSTDLLEGVVATSNLGLVVGSPAQLTDGIGTNNFAHRVIASDSTSDWVLTFDLDPLLGPGLRASIDELNIYTYNTDTRRVIDLDVLYSRDHGTTWQYAFIGANNIPLGNGLVTLTSLLDTSGDPIMRGVTDLRLNLRRVWINVRHSSLIEVDAIGEITPEPGTLTLLALGGLAALARRRRKRQAAGAQRKR